ncbi:formate dehydrogenase subunit gamma [Oceanimonas baumannii]|uniref:formate dehydrogenase subunit gamma n=1 Tax=Oceanimonas baumannii TaxID=129578 RepID=UPI001D1869DC|nr:formate dehydrogenase subunit gamma [Oceanimonas baumannii]MCC4263980.1 formate dehydrogenase subunit gamma [Oceanimonas baumannii]
MVNSGKDIVRYTANQRLNHWLIALSFVLLAITGLALFHPSLFWLSNLLGGGTWTRILHPFIGLVMFVSFAAFALQVWRHNHITADDKEWLKAVPKVISHQEEGVPDADRYNGGQKVLFWLLVVLMAGLLVSGIVMWRSYFSFPVELIRLSSLLHALFAFGLICAIIVHVYAGIWVKGSIQAMTRGTVSPAWAWKHHRKWFRRKMRNAPNE